MLFPISYVFLFIPVNYILDKRGLKLGTAIFISPFRQVRYAWWRD